MTDQPTRRDFVNCFHEESVTLLFSYFFLNVLYNKMWFWKGQNILKARLKNVSKYLILYEFQNNFCPPKITFQSGSYS